MPEILSVSKIVLPYKCPQSELKNFARETFTGKFNDIDRLLESFENAMIDFRNICVPVDYFRSQKTFKQKNDLFIELSLKYSVQAIEQSLESSGIDKNEITDIIFISSTGISTPGIDALIINEMKLNPNVNRYPLWGLGCAGGVSGIAKANTIAKADPQALVAVVSAELCSLTFIRDDVSKSNFIATGLFSDGIAAVLVKGDENENANKNNFSLKIIDSRSKLYYDTLDVMGWEILDEGFKVVFSKDIPNIVNQNVKGDIYSFLNKQNLTISDIKNFVTHPGGIKVINAYIDALNIDPVLMNNTREVLKEFGNMSSATVLYVLDRFIEIGFEKGYTLMMSLGPGFSSEMVLLEAIIKY